MSQREAVARAIAQHVRFNSTDEIDAAADAAIAAYEAAQKPVAYMRRWAFDGVDVMKMKKVDRPLGWAYYATTDYRLLPDDVPLYARPLPAPPEAQP